ncbi:MAG: hypothetical protein FWE25_11035 [Lachnospiraceae bacterium]|nr:hypothetical protein [Lachnospiraceae bacterium]
MTPRQKLNMLRWGLFEIITLIIGALHMILIPAHRTYALPFYGVLFLGLIAWVITLLVLKSKGRKNN